MADPAEKIGPEDNGVPRNRKAKPSFLFIGMLALNTMAIVGMALLLYFYMQEKAALPTMEPLINGANKAQQEAAATNSGYTIPLDHFLVNLSGDQGHKLFKVTMEFVVDNAEVQDEINKRMAQVRDIIIILLSSRNYSQVSTPKGKEKLKEEIRDTVNSFLTKGKINKVLFTEFIYT